MTIGRSQMRKQVEGQLRGARKIKKGCQRFRAKASKTHAKQSKILKGLLNGSKKGTGKKA